MAKTKKDRSHHTSVVAAVVIVFVFGCIKKAKLHGMNKFRETVPSIVRQSQESNVLLDLPRPLEPWGGKEPLMEAGRRPQCSPCLLYNHLSKINLDRYEEGVTCLCLTT